MKKLMNRAGLLAAAFALALAVALALNAATQTPEVAQAQTTGVAEVQSATCDPKSHDRDGNGLIDICTPAQLNAMRWDLDGDGMVSGVDHTEYAKSFIIPPCTTSIPCKGYELMEDISLADYPTWEPIGPRGAVFDGNGFSIRGLRGNNGLFGNIDPETVVKNVDVVDAEIIVAAEQGGAVGVLANVNRGTIIGSYVTGEITRKATENNGSLGGLVGHNMETGKIYASVAEVDIKVTAIPFPPRGTGRLALRAGGFAGVNYGEIRRSYAYGDLRDARSKWEGQTHETTTDTKFRGAANSGRFQAHGFAVNHGGRGGTIHSSFSYGNKIVTNGDDTTPVAGSLSPAKFASGLNSGSNSCELDQQWKFTFAQSKCATDD